jgi:hypothetical protein
LGVGLYGLAGGLRALHQSLDALEGHSLRLSEQNICLLTAICSAYGSPRAIKPLAFEMQER